MSSSPDPSSSAAQSAPQTDELPERKPGFFARFFGTAPDPEPESINGVPALPAVDGAPGLVPGTGMSNLRRLRVEDVSIPRVEIISVSCDIELDDLVAVFRQSGLTRLPVYDGTLDTPIGMVHLKDVALRYGFNGGGGGFSLRTMLRPLLYAPPSMPIGVLLQKMQTDRTHMALVIDEYGGVDGLVTIEDLIEQVIGEIEDEHDVEEDRPWLMEDAGSYLALARAPLDEFEAEIGMKLVEEADEDEIDTLGGVVFVLTGRVPARGEVIPHPSGAEFEVVDADPRRIKRLRVRLPKGS
ncbi:hemolysin family protein [Rhodophyticola sp.]|uniref:hemolysin family protein n=1 Tax=Rhodophyticola sp. TaxID=2680032 RepID=UPI001B05D501|nr:HlyC/CorC family transporter [Roseicyclus sp.]MBO6624358.1 HlyC/CorC family transporter [Roseicyclus sp.]MBO6921606.1 HlyC/CorC family transporter [Roseicyclus sp.]